MLKQSMFGIASEKQLTDEVKMALENYDNWQTGESNSFEEFIYRFMGLALICIIISIFYTPEQKTTDVNKSKTQQTIVKTQK